MRLPDQGSVIAYVIGFVKRTSLDSLIPPFLKERGKSVMFWVLESQVKKLVIAPFYVIA